MPNRVLRDWTDSEKINSLSFQAEVLFVRIIMKADDFGRYSANPKLLRSLLFPLRDGVRDSDISRWLAECETAGLIRVYTAADKPLLEVGNFRQRTRSSVSKYPAPDSQPPIVPRPVDSQMTAARPSNDGHVTVIGQSDDGHVRTYSETETKTKTDPPLLSPPGESGSDGKPEALSTRSKPFKPPTVEEVAAFVKERALNVDPSYFCEFYGAKGWMIGKSPMKNWNLACLKAHREGWGNPAQKSVQQPRKVVFS